MTVAMGFNPWEGFQPPSQPSFVPLPVASRRLNGWATNR